MGSVNIQAKILPNNRFWPQTQGLAPLPVWEILDPWPLKVFLFSLNSTKSMSHDKPAYSLVELPKVNSDIRQKTCNKIEKLLACLLEK